MAENKKREFVKLLTPKAVTKFVKLNEPDYKFKPEGVFYVDCLFDPQVFAAQLQPKMDEMVEESYSKACAENPAKVKKMSRVYPYKNDEDKEGNETGLIKCRFSMYHEVTYDKGKATEKKVKRNPAVYDSVGKPFDMTIPIFGGSTVKVNFTPSPYFMAKDVECGISLRLNAVQVIDLRTTGCADASAFGFGEEEGYVGEDSVGKPKGDDEGDGDPDF